MDSKKAKKISRKTIKNNLSIVRQLSKYSPSRIPFECVNIAFSTFFRLTFGIYLVPFIIKAIEESYSVEKLLTYALGLFIIMLIYSLYSAWYYNIYVPKSNLKIQQGFQTMLFDRVCTIDLIHYDNPEFYNQSVRVAGDISSRSLKVLESLTDWFSGALTAIFATGIVVTREPILLACVVISVVLTNIINAKMNKNWYEYDQANALPFRKCGYVDGVFSSVAAAKELRLFKNCIIPFENIFTHGTKLKLEYIRKYGGKTAIYTVFYSLSQLLFSSVLPYAYLGYRAVVSHTFNASGVVTMINGVRTMINSFWRISYIINTSADNNQYIQNYLDFMTIENKITENPDGIVAKKNANSIELKNVSYTYPNSSEPVIKNISMSIKAGQKVALVGENGSGKTTLIKLIMRLYIPDSGEICMDGIPEEDYRLSSLRDRFGVIFQDFQLYAQSVGENVMMNTLSEGDEDTVNYALKQSGLYDRIYEEPDNISSNVLKEFDENGLILSGGQGQKLAIARVFAKECGVVIMDEPSSALDPIAEYEMYKNMTNASKDKTVILISHRLSATKDADCIFYLENGQIAEQGTHSELMARKGGYARMFNMQAQKFSGKGRDDIEIQ